MARRFDRIVIGADRGDGKPFIQVEWYDAENFHQTREIADFANATNITRIQQILTYLKGLVDAEVV